MHMHWHMLGMPYSYCCGGPGAPDVWRAQRPAGPAGGPPDLRHRQGRHCEAGIQQPVPGAARVQAAALLCRHMPLKLCLHWPRTRQASADELQSFCIHHCFARPRMSGVTLRPCLALAAGDACRRGIEGAGCLKVFMCRSPWSHMTAQGNRGSKFLHVRPCWAASTVRLVSCLLDSFSCGRTSGYLRQHGYLGLGSRFISPPWYGRCRAALVLFNSATYSCIRGGAGSLAVVGRSGSLAVALLYCSKRPDAHDTAERWHSTVTCARRAPTCRRAGGLHSHAQLAGHRTARSPALCQPAMQRARPGPPCCGAT